MSKRVAFLLVLLVLVVAAAIWLWPRKADDPPTVGPDAAAVQKSTLPTPITQPVERAEEPAPEPVRPIAAEVVRDASAENGAFEGVVLNWSTGRPVAGADVTFASAGQAHSVTSGARGEFRFVPPRAGRYTLATVTANGFLPFAPELDQSPIDVVARAGLRLTGLTIFIGPAIDYQGLVVAPDGKPVPGATVEIIEGTGPSALEPLPGRFVADARGEFVFHAFDDALLEARHPGYASGRARLDGSAQTSHRLTLRLRPAGAPEPSARIAGRVVDEAGQPIAGARLSVEGEDLRRGAEGDSGADGRFDLGPLDSGRYQLTAEADGRASARLAATAGDADLVVRLGPGARLAGRVRAANAPVASFHVVVLEKTGPLARRPVTTRAFLDGAGEFVVDGLAAGPYLLVVTAHGHAPSGEVAAEAVTGAPRAVDVELPRGGVVTGKVVSADGKPLPLARLTIEGAAGAGSYQIPVATSSTSDDRGAFELRGVPAGMRSILAGAYGHHMRIVGIEVRDGATVGPISIQLTPTAPGEEPRLELAGIGVALSAEGETLKINTVMPGGGAADAGLVVGDLIVAVDGQPVTSLGFEGSMQRIRGPEGTQVRLSLRRGDAVADVVVTRKKIRA